MCCIFVLRMKLGQLSNESTEDDTFEYNNLDPEEAQAFWLAEWYKQKQLEFELNSKMIAKDTTYIKKLADLFKESYEVRKLSFTKTLRVFLRIVFRTKNICGWTGTIIPLLP